MSDATGRPGGRNVLGGPLQACSFDPLTGFFRDGCCNTAAGDIGSHTVCARVTDAFLEFGVRRGNDLVTPRPEYRFKGLRAGDRWFLCAARWLEAYEAGVARPVVLEATHEWALAVVPMKALRAHAWVQKPAASR